MIDTQCMIAWNQAPHKQLPVGFLAKGHRSDHLNRLPVDASTKVTSLVRQLLLSFLTYRFVRDVASVHFARIWCRVHLVIFESKIFDG